MRCCRICWPDFERVLASFGAVLFSDYGKGGLTHIARMIGWARAAGKPVLVDPKGSDYSRYAGASVLTPNLAELAEVIGGRHSEAQLLERAQALRQRLKVDSLVLTRSEQGMSLFDAAGHMHGAGAGARGIRRHRRRRYRDRHAGGDAGGRRQRARGTAGGQSGRRHRGRQVWHRQRQL
jgi:rfaE bifunctional protein kinase chain/domain